MAEVKKWRVTLNRWDVYVVRDIEAANEEEAKDVAFEWFDDDFNVEHEDGGLNSVEAEEVED